MAEENGRAKGGREGMYRGREDMREEKDGGGKEESKGKSCCAPPETKSWLRHCVRVCSIITVLFKMLLTMVFCGHCVNPALLVGMLCTVCGVTMLDCLIYCLQSLMPLFGNLL